MTSAAKRPYVRGTPEDRFWPKVDRRGPDECWPWKGGRGGNGYGAFRGPSGMRRPHVFACEIGAGRRAEPGEVARHGCDNRICCNPGHLSFGTPKENIHDAIARGRLKCGRADRHGSTKLTSEQVRAILASDKTNTDLANIYGVKQHTISNIRNRKTWKSVEV